MSQRLAIVLSVVLTAFVLVIAGAVIGRVSLNPAGDAAAATGDVAAESTAVPAAEVAAPAADPAAGQAAALPADREAAYQELIRQANQRLQAAYDQIKAQQAAQAVAQPAVQPAVQPAAATPSLITSDQAAAIAGLAAPGAILLSPPQLVNYQGTTAYQVNLNNGSLYIDAQTGQILYNGVLSAPGTLGSGGGAGRAHFTTSSENRSDSSGSGGSGGGEHESGGGGGDD